MEDNINMIKIYLSPSCSSCRKVKAWFLQQHIPFQEVNILKQELTEDDLKEMLEKSLDGTDEIISTRSKIFREQNIDVDSMSLKELLSFIQQNPTILKRPIIVDEDKIQVGYNSDEIEIFEREKEKRIVEQARAIALKTCQNCPNKEGCEHRYDDTKAKIRAEYCEGDECEGDEGKEKAE